MGKTITIDTLRTQLADFLHFQLPQSNVMFVTMATVFEDGYRRTQINVASPCWHPT